MATLLGRHALFGFALVLVLQGGLVAGAGHAQHLRHLLQSNTSLPALNATVNDTVLNGTGNGTGNNSTHQSLISKEFQSINKNKAEIVIVAVLCSLMMVCIIGCVVMWYIKRFGKVKLQLPAFLRRRRAADKFSRYEDNAFDGEGDRF